MNATSLALSTVLSNGNASAVAQPDTSCGASCQWQAFLSWYAGVFIAAQFVASKKSLVKRERGAVGRTVTLVLLTFSGLPSYILFNIAIDHRMMTTTVEAQLPNATTFLPPPLNTSVPTSSLARTCADFRGSAESFILPCGPSEWMVIGAAGQRVGDRCCTSVDPGPRCDLYGPHVRYVPASFSDATTQQKAECCPKMPGGIIPKGPSLVYFSALGGIASKFVQNGLLYAFKALVLKSKPPMLAGFFTALGGVSDLVFLTTALAFIGGIVASAIVAASSTEASVLLRLLPSWNEYNTFASAILSGGAFKALTGFFALFFGATSSRRPGQEVLETFPTLRTHPRNDIGPETQEGYPPLEDLLPFPLDAVEDSAPPKADAVDEKTATKNAEARAAELKILSHVSLVPMPRSYRERFAQVVVVWNEEHITAKPRRIPMSGAMARRKQAAAGPEDREGKFQRAFEEGYFVPRPGSDTAAATELDEAVKKQFVELLEEPEVAPRGKSVVPPRYALCRSREALFWALCALTKWPPESVLAFMRRDAEKPAGSRDPMLSRVQNAADWWYAPDGQPLVYKPVDMVNFTAPMGIPDFGNPARLACIVRRPERDLLWWNDFRGYAAWDEDTRVRFVQRLAEVDEAQARVLVAQQEAWAWQRAEAYGASTEKSRGGPYGLLDVLDDLVQRSKDAGAKKREAADDDDADVSGDVVVSAADVSYLQLPPHECLATPLDLMRCCGTEHDNTGPSDEPLKRYDMDGDFAFALARYDPAFAGKSWRDAVPGSNAAALAWRFRLPPSAATPPLPGSSNSAGPAAAYEVVTVPDAVTPAGGAEGDYPAPQPSRKAWGLMNDVKRMAWLRTALPETVGNASQTEMLELLEKIANQPHEAPRAFFERWLYLKPFEYEVLRNVELLPRDEVPEEWMVYREAVEILRISSNGASLGDWRTIALCVGMLVCLAPVIVTHVLPGFVMYLYPTNLVVATYLVLPMMLVHMANTWLGRFLPENSRTAVALHGTLGVLIKVAVFDVLFNIFLRMPGEYAALMYGAGDNPYLGLGRGAGLSGVAGHWHVPFHYLQIASPTCFGLVTWAGGADTWNNVLSFIV